MITPIRHPKLNKDFAYLHSKSDSTHECVTKNGYENEKKSEQKRITMNQSASANFEGGFFSPKKQDSVSFAGGKKEDIWTKIGKNEKVRNFFKNPKFLKFLEKTNDVAWMESIFMFAIATTIKPITILAVPGAKDEDKKYAATKAFLGGVVDFSIGTLFILPVTLKLKKFHKKIEANPKIITEKVPFLKCKAKFDVFKDAVAYAPKFLLLPVRSAITIALIPPTLKFLFPEEAKKLHEKKKRQNSLVRRISPQFAGGVLA